METRNLDKKLIKEIEDRIVTLSNATILQEYGYEIRFIGGSFNNNSATVKLDISRPIQVAAKALQGEKPSDIGLRNGIAPRGTEIVFRDAKYVILRSRRTKYEIEKVGDLSGRIYVLPFHLAKLA